MVKLALVLLITLLAGSASAQERLPLRQLLKQDGLSQNSVIAIAQDGKGFMWFGTRDGLNRYDGVEFRAYRQQRARDRGLVFNDIHALLYDPLVEGLWVGTTRGLCRYRQATDDFVHYGEGTDFADRFIYFLYRDHEQQLWAGTDRGLYRYAEGDDRFEPVSGLPEQTFRVMTQDEQGRYYVGTPRGLFRLTPDSGERAALLEPLALESKRAGEAVYVQDLLTEAGGYLWVASRFSGLYRVELSSGRVGRYVAAAGQLSDDNVRTLAWGEDGSLWAGTFMGLNRMGPGRDTFQQFSERGYAAGDQRNHSIHSLFLDRRGTLWLGSYFGGVAYYDSRLEGVRHYGSRGQGLRSGVVSAFAETAAGDLWVGTEGSGLHYFDRAADTLRRYATGRGSDGKNIKSLLLDGDRLWIGTYQGPLAYLDTDSGELVGDWGPIADSARQELTNVYDLLLRRDTLWIANYGKGLSLLDRRSGRLRTVSAETGTDSTLLSTECRSLYEDRKGNVWMATQAGLSRITVGTGGQLRFTHYLREQVVYALCEDREGQMWVGTYGQGLFVIDPLTGEAERYEQEDGTLAESTVYSIIPDDRGWLWISSNQGIASQDTATGRFRNSDTPYKLKEQEYRINAAHHAASGKLFFGGTEGMTVFDPRAISRDSELPPVVFTKLQVANQEVPIEPAGGLLQRNIDEAEEITLAYNNANFSLSFAPLDFLSPDKYRYAYRLEGLDEGWINSRGATTVNYTLQNAGRYRFRVRVFADGDTAGFTERQLEIRVLPPPWRSGYAYLGYTVLLGLLLTAATRYFYLQHQLREEQREKDQQEALHQAKLRFFTNITHELRTPLTLMLGPLESVRRNGEVRGENARRLLTVEKNSRRLLQLVNELLSLRKLEGKDDPLQLDGHDMVEFCEDIVAAFRGYAETSGKQLRFVTDQAHHPVSFDRDKLEKVVYNLLANAFKFTGAGGHVELRLRREGTRMHLEVADDGEGIPAELHEQIFARFFERASLTKREGTGIGLAVAREYVEMHGGEITVRSQPGRGSTFRLWIPLRRPVLTPLSTVDPRIGRAPEVITQLRERLAEPKSAGPPPLILVVEDNEEVRDYIESVLVEDYRLVTAVDGKDGLEKAGSCNPDLVLSDVMMPVMDGIALCAALKADIQISHIPVILLTAKSSDLQKLEGLEIGANDYLTKPFSPRELQLRVANLLAAIRSARERTGRTLRLEPAEVEVASADAVFLERAIDVVNAEMGNADYRVDHFARDLAVSRALLFTKMKAITGHTPNNFIKLLRMKRAAQLLETGELQVAEVAARVGYRDVKYFSSSFAKAHGCNPSVYGCEKTS